MMIEMFIKRFVKTQKESDEQFHVTQKKHDKKFLKEQIEQINAKCMAIIGMLQYGKSSKQKPDHYKKMEPEPERIKMTANAEDAVSLIKT